MEKASDKLETSEILVQGVKDMLDVLASVVNNNCVITKINKDSVEWNRIVEKCGIHSPANPDSSEVYAKVQWGCVQNQIESPNVIQLLTEEWTSIKNQVLRDIILRFRWSQMDQMLLDDHMNRMVQTLERECQMILVEELFRDTIDCDVIAPMWAQSPALNLQSASTFELNSYDSFVVPFPFKIQFTKNRNFITEFDILYHMTSTKDERQQRSALCIIFIFLIILALVIVILVLIRHHWWVLPRNRKKNSLL